MKHVRVITSHLRVTTLQILLCFCNSQTCCILQLVTDIRSAGTVSNSAHVSVAAGAPVCCFFILLSRTLVMHTSINRFRDRSGLISVRPYCAVSFYHYSLMSAQMTRSSDDRFTPSLTANHLSSLLKHILRPSLETTGSTCMKVWHHM